MDDHTNSAGRMARPDGAFGHKKASANAATNQSGLIAESMIYLALFISYHISRMCAKGTLKSYPVTSTRNLSYAGVTSLVQVSQRRLTTRINCFWF